MSIPVLTFFTNKSWIGKTSLVYHLSWMFSELNKRVVVLDLDPQANLTAAFLDEEQLEPLWEDPKGNETVYHCVKPLMEVGDLQEPLLQKISENLYLVPGDVALASFEDSLSAE